MTQVTRYNGDDWSNARPRCTLGESPTKPIPMPKLAVAALLALALPSAARGGDIVITVTGTVFAVNPGVPSGPFTGAAAQDPVTLRMEVFVPGVVVAPLYGKRGAAPCSAARAPRWCWGRS